MNPTPEQMAFAFAMLTLRTRPDSPFEGAQFESNGLLRFLAMVVVGVTAGLFALSYIEGNVATGGRSPEEIRSLGDAAGPYPTDLDSDESADQTASAR